MAKLPKEIWVEIWSLVDFITLQKSCTVVCKNWFERIRGSTILSSQMVLNNCQKSLEDINLVLSHWDKLRIVRMSSEMPNVELLQLAIHPSLEKIIFPKKFELGIWGKVTKVCFDLKHKSSETSIENIVELHLVNFFENCQWKTRGDEVGQPFLKRFKSEDISLEAIACKMLNLETLHVFSDILVSYIEPEKMKYFASFFRGLQHCKNLSELILPTAFGDYANYTPNIKKLEIKGNSDFPIEELDWIGNLRKLEILKLDFLRFEDQETDIKDFTAKMFGDLTCLKILELDDCSLMYEPAFLMNMLEIIPSLENLTMTTDLGDSFPMNIENLIYVLDSIGNVKNVCIKDDSYPTTFYITNNKEFQRTLPNNLDEGQIRAIFHTAFDIINKKFSIDATSLGIVDNQYGWSIKKDKGKPPTLTQLPFKCTWMGGFSDTTCTEFFAEKTKWEEHEAEESTWHRFPNPYL